MSRATRPSSPEYAIQGETVRTRRGRRRIVQVQKMASGYTYPAGRGEQRDLQERETEPHAGAAQRVGRVQWILAGARRHARYADLQGPGGLDDTLAYPGGA